MLLVRRLGHELELELEIEGDLLASILRPDTAGGRRASEGRQSSRKNIEKGVVAVIVVIRIRESSRRE
jgi:hypothetical protein